MLHSRNVWIPGRRALNPKPETLTPKPVLNPKLPLHPLNVKPCPEKKTQKCETAQRNLPAANILMFFDIAAANLGMYLLGSVSRVWDTKNSHQTNRMWRTHKKKHRTLGNTYAYMLRMMLPT